VMASNNRDPFTMFLVADPRRSAEAETAPIAVARQGPLTCPLATFAVPIYNGSFTSTPAVRGARKTLIVQMGTNAPSEEPGKSTRLVATAPKADGAE
jgi:hypothetical protein